MQAELDKAIAVVGVGAVLPDAPDARTFWKNVCTKRCSIRDVPADRWSAADYFDPDPRASDKTYSKVGSWIEGFEFDWKRFRIPPRVAAAMDEGQKWAVTAAAEALADYGYPERPLDKERTGVVLGTAMGGEQHLAGHLRISFPEYLRALESVEEFRQLPDALRETLRRKWRDAVGRAFAPITEDTMPGELPNVVSGRVANVLDLRGPNFIADAACASSLAAVATAAESLLARRCDAVLTGGVDHNMTPSAFVKFCKIGALSATGSRPFGQGADGFVMGEGCAVLLLKRLADAQRQGDRIYAVIRGIGASSDGRGKGITAPNPKGQRLAMQRAWQNAGLDPATATMVEAHGTSTKVGDVVEAESLQHQFAAAQPGSVALGSVKSNIGHLKAAAGAASLLKCVFALHERKLPPTLSATPTNPQIDLRGSPLRLQSALTDWQVPEGTPRRAGVSAFGFGGTNFHVVLEEAPSPGPTSQARGVFALGATDPDGLRAQLAHTLDRLQNGWEPPKLVPDRAALAQPERLVIDYGGPQQLLERARKASQALAADAPAAWKALRARGVFRGSGPRPGKLAFLFPGQGSQYLNMGRPLCEGHAVAANVFARADGVMGPLLGRPLTAALFFDGDGQAERQQAELALQQTEITQPAVLTLDIALCQLLETSGFTADVVMGHSLGEYAALVAAGILPFEHALEAAAARGREMSQVQTPDPGLMAAVFASREAIEALLAQVEGYVVLANVNSHRQCVIGGASAAVEQAMAACDQAGLRAVRLPVSHAFHTSIVAPAAAPLRKVLDRLAVGPPRRTVIANVSGEPYPQDVEAIKDLLQQQIASPVQWVDSLETAYRLGVRTFVEVGPKTALSSFVADVLGDKPDVVSLHSNHPKTGQTESLNHALCGLYAAGYGAEVEVRDMAPSHIMPAETARTAGITGSVVITGTGLGLPGADKPIMAEDNVERILRGDQLIDGVPERLQDRMLEKRITRLVKGADGSGRFETIVDPDAVIRLAGRGGPFDLAAEYGIDRDRIEAFDTTTELAIAAGLDALREAGIPLVRTYKRTTAGTHLPDRWQLPEPMRDETGVIFASAFPGLDRFADELGRYHAWQSAKRQLDELEALRQRTRDPETLDYLHERAGELREQLSHGAFAFDRRFVFRVLAMGHAQFAELVGARGPNTHVNAACASSTQALSLAEDWIRGGRCRRVVVLAADNVTSEHLFEWIGSGFLATGAAATDGRVREAALPFDRRRHGLVLGMGASAMVVESEDAVRERGMQGIVEVLSTETRNSAFHGTRLDAQHIAAVMDSLVTTAERRFGLSRQAMAPGTLFVSHETYTPARGGSAAAEVAALRHTFGDATSRVVICNTKGLTGHPMGVGIEDVVGVKALEHGRVPAVPNFKEADPALGELCLSRGGRYPVRYAIRLAAGFGSQLAMTLTRRIPGPLDRVADATRRARWLADVTGYAAPETEVEKRVLRVKDQGLAQRPPVPSSWQPGVGPTERALVEAPMEHAATTATRPAPRLMEAPRHMLERELTVAPRPLEPTSRPEVSPESPRRLAPEPLGAAAPGPVPAPAPDPPPEPEAVHAPEPKPAPAAVSAVVPEPEPSPPPAPAHDDSVQAQVLAIVAEQTGYPPEMLDLDLDLEADLGIDTVKQAETFAALRARFHIPKRDDLSLRDYPTLESVIRFVHENRPPEPAGGSDSATAADEEQSVATEPAAIVPRQPVARAIAPLSLHRATGVELDDRSRVIIVMDQRGVGQKLTERLQAHDVELLVIEPGTSAEALHRSLERWLADGPVQGVFWLPALDDEPVLADMELAEWRELLDVRVKRLHRTMQLAYDSIRHTGTFLIGATRLDGQHGLGLSGAWAPLGGAVSGFCKAYRQERPEALVKVVDVEPECDVVRVADRLLAEALHDPKTVEVGYVGTQRYGIALEPTELRNEPLALGPEPVFVVSGAAGSITSRIVGELARASRGTFYLLDRVAEPREHAPELDQLAADRDALKEQLIREADRPTPREIEQRLFALEREAATKSVLDAVRQTGGTAHYRTVDLLEPASVLAVMEEIRQRHGRIDVLVHAAGVEQSHALPNKSSAEFDRVFDVKADGWFNLLRAATDLPIGAVVAFSSVAGRFGNSGQTDYSAANDLLCKLVSHLRRCRPATRGLAIDWTAWEGAGMASRGSVPQLLAQAGVELLPAAIGVPVVRQLLSDSEARGEVVIAGRMGLLERDDTRTLELAALRTAISQGEFPFLSAAELVGAHQTGATLQLEFALDPTEQPFLTDHQVEQGVPYLPGVVGAEYFAEVARLIAPERVVAAVEQLEFERPLKFRRGDKRTLRVTADSARPASDGALVVHTRLESLLPPPRPELEPRWQLHFSAELRLSRGMPQPPLPDFSLDRPQAPATVSADIYRTFFHGPSFRVLDSVQVEGNRAVGQMATGLPPDSTAPPPASSQIEPRLLELCFQTAGQWEMTSKGKLCLPRRVKSATMYEHPPAAEPLYALVTAQDSGETFQAQVVDDKGRVYLAMDGYRTIGMA